MLVDLVHLLAQQAELNHRAVVLDEARVRGAAGGGELGPEAGDFLDRAANQVDERPRWREEYVGVRRLPFDVPADLATRGTRQARVRSSARSARRFTMR